MRGWKVNLTVVFKGKEMVRIRSQGEAPRTEHWLFHGRGQKRRVYTLSLPV